MQLWQGTQSGHKHCHVVRVQSVVTNAMSHFQGIQCGHQFHRLNESIIAELIYLRKNYYT